MGRRFNTVLRPADVVGRGKEVWSALVAEFLGPFFIVLVGCGSCVQNWENKDNADPLDLVQIALAFGLTVATLVQAVGHISGAHLNPAVTLAMVITGKIGLLKALLYVIAQCLGGIAGAGVLKALTPEVLHARGLGQTVINPSLNPVQGFGVEFLITFVLVLVVFSLTDEGRSDITGSVPLAVGISIAMCHLFAIRYTGSSMNPARSLGPAIITNVWEHHWVYWLGPCTGGALAAILYHTTFNANRRQAIPRGDEYAVTAQVPDTKEEKLMPADSGC